MGLLGGCRRRSGTGSTDRAACVAGGALRRCDQSLADGLLAGELAGAPDGFRLFAGLALRRLLVGAPRLHLAEDALALHLLLERAKGLVDVVLSDENLHGMSFLADGEFRFATVFGDGPRKMRGTPFTEPLRWP